MFNKKPFLLFLVLFLLNSTYTFGQTQYKSTKMSFIYPNNYELKDSRILDPVLVKLVTKDKKFNQNIIVNITNKYASLIDVDKEVLIKDLTSEYDRAMKKLKSKIEFNTILYEKKTIYGKELIYVKNKIDLVEYNISIYQLAYLYVKDGKNCYVIISYDDDVYDENYKSDADYIIRNFRFL